MDWEHSAVRSVVATLLDAAICVLIQRFLPASYKREVSGSPLWSWYVGGFHQSVVFPACALFALSPVFSGQMTFLGWLHSSFAGATASLGCTYLHVALIAYWAKDVIAIKCSALIWAHHLVCIGGTAASLAGLLGPSAGLFGLGATVLELGSLANTACEVSPGAGGQALRMRLTPVMLATNVTAAGLVVWYACTFRSVSVVARVAVVLVGVALSAIRQQEWNSRIGTDEVGARFKSGKGS